MNAYDAKTYDELVDQYIEKFGGMPWDFMSMTKEDAERHIKKALETGKPFKSRLTRRGVKY